MVNLVIDTLGPRCDDEKRKLISIRLFIYFRKLFIACEEKMVLFDLQEIWDCKRLNTLIECLWDTYLVNKNAVLSLLLTIEVQTFKRNVSAETLSH